MTNKSMQIVAENILFTLSYSPQLNSSSASSNNTQISLSYLNQQHKIKKFIISTNIVGKNCHFLQLQDLVEFMKQPINYQWNKQSAVLILKWKMSAFNFVRQNCLTLKFQQQQLNQRQLMEAQNKLLKKQLDFFKIKLNRQSRIEQISNKGKQSTQKQIGQQQKHNQKSTPKNYDSFSSEPRNLSISSISTKLKKGRPKTNNVLNNSVKLPILLRDRIQLLKNKNIKQKSYLRPRQKKIKSKQKIIAKTQQLIKKSKTKLIKKSTKKSKTKKYIKKSQVQKYKKKNNNQPSQTLKNLVKKQDEYKSNVYQQEQQSYSRQVNCRQSLKNLVEIQKRLIRDNIYEIKYKNGNKYQGQLRNNKFNGHGVYYTKSYRHDGLWRDGQPNGRGTSYYADGGVQSGIYRSGFKRFGIGQDKYTNGQSYVGSFHNQKKNGTGTYYFPNNQYYQGEWKDDLQHGKGIQYLKDGTRLQGIWVEDQKHGEFLCITKFGKIKQIYDHGELLKEFVVLDQ